MTNGADDSDEKTLSDAVREMIFEADEHPDKKEIQLQILDTTLTNLANTLQRKVGDSLSEIFNTFSPLSPEARNMMIIASITKGEFNPTIATKISLNTEFTDFSAFDVAQLPGYAALHEAAQNLNVAINFSGFTSDERGQVLVMVDIGKTYEEGRNASSYGYPELPPKPESQRPGARKQPDITLSQAKPRPGRHQL